MEEKPTKKRAAKRSAEPKAAVPKADEKLIVGLATGAGASLKELCKAGAGANAVPTAAKEEIKVSVKEAAAMLDALEEAIKQFKEKSKKENDKFKVSGLYFNPKGTSKKYRTLFIDDQVFVEFVIDEDTGTTAFFPYKPYDNVTGKSSVTFPTDWLVEENAEQLALMGCGATVSIPEYADCCDCRECCKGEDLPDDEESISLDELARLAIKQFGSDLDDFLRIR